jgi:hypothetical protein
VGVRFKRLIMDDTGIMPKSREPRPPQESDYKRVVFCSGKVRHREWGSTSVHKGMLMMVAVQHACTLCTQWLLYHMHAPYVLDVCCTTCIRLMYWKYAVHM